MLVSIGVMLLLGGSSIFIMGLARHFFPSLGKFIPDGFKKIISIRYAVYIFLAGLLLVRFF